MIVVSNTTPLIGLASIDHFNLLEDLFSEVIIPQAVYTEATVKRHTTDNLADTIANSKSIKIISVTNIDAVDGLLHILDRGEAEAIVLAQELNANIVLMDERQGRNQLAARGIPKIGTVGILLKAKQLGIITQIKPCLDDLRARQFRMSESLYTQALYTASELSS